MADMGCARTADCCNLEIKLTFGETPGRRQEGGEVILGNGFLACSIQQLDALLGHHQIEQAKEKHEKMCNELNSSYQYTIGRERSVACGYLKQAGFADIRGRIAREEIFEHEPEGSHGDSRIIQRNIISMT